MKIYRVYIVWGKWYMAVIPGLALFATLGTVFQSIYTLPYLTTQVSSHRYPCRCAVR